MKYKQAWMAALVGLVLAGAATAQPYGMGPGMMDYDGYEMGPGMMWGYGRGHGFGMGPGGERGAADIYAGIDLSAEQRKKIADIRRETSKAMWQLMGTMHEQRDQAYGALSPGVFDEDAARKTFQAMTQTRNSMFELQLDGRKKMDAVLSKEQREQLRRQSAR